MKENPKRIESYSGYLSLKEGDIINEDTEFEFDKGNWRRVGDSDSITSTWLIGLKYIPWFFVRARQPVASKQKHHDQP